MTIDNIIEQIQAKYHYYDDLLEIIKPVITSMVEYYGEEFVETILNAFLNTPIVVCNNKEQMIEGAHNLGVKDEFVLPIIAGGAFEEHFQYNDNGEVERIPFVMINGSYNQDKHEQFIHTIIHEMCHMVMNYGNSRIDGDKITSRTGFIEDNVVFRNGKFVSDSKHVPIEEGFNEYDARVIADLVFGRHVDVGTYGLYIAYIEPLTSNPEFRKMINKSRLNGDQEWMKVMGEEFSREFMDALEKYVDFLFKNDIRDKEERERVLGEKKQELIKYRDKAAELIQQYNFEQERSRI